MRLLLLDLNDRHRASLGRLFQPHGIDAEIHLARTQEELERQLAARPEGIFCRPDLPDLPLPRVQRLLEARQPGALLTLLPHNGIPDDQSIRQFIQQLRRNQQHLDHDATMEMLRQSEHRFRALATNIPGAAFELARQASSRYQFEYMSEGSQSLLGLKPHELLGNFQRLLDLLESEDQADFLTALEDSAARMKMLNWEGRIRPEGQSRPKWINLRSTPQWQADGCVHWHGIVSDITRSKETEAALRRSREQAAELSNYLEAAKEEERERIARDIHDDLGSLLVALKIEFSLLAGKLPEPAEGLRNKVSAIESLLAQAMATASRVARELRPGILKEFGLQAAIECQAEDFAQRTGITCRVRWDEGTADLDEKRALPLFRIIQEALTNVAKHAHASLVVLRVYRDGRHLVVEVRDNGRGIAEADINKPRSFGLRGMRERCHSLGGEFHIAASEQGGTHLVTRIPFKAAICEPAKEEDPQGNLF